MEIIYLVFAYPKNVKDNLTNAEKAELKKLTTSQRRFEHEHFKELKTSLQEAVDIKQGAKSPTRVTRFEVADVKTLRSQLFKITPNSSTSWHLTKL